MTDLVIRTFDDETTKETTSFRSTLIDIYIEYFDDKHKPHIIDLGNIKDFFSIQLFFKHEKKKPTKGGEE